MTTKVFGPVEKEREVVENPFRFDTLTSFLNRGILRQIDPATMIRSETEPRLRDARDYGRIWIDTSMREMGVGDWEIMMWNGHAWLPYDEHRDNFQVDVYRDDCSIKQLFTYVYGGMKEAQWCYQQVPHRKPLSYFTDDYKLHGIRLKALAHENTLFINNEIPFEFIEQRFYTS